MNSVPSGLGSGLATLIYTQFIGAFPKLSYVLEIGFQNSFLITAAASQHGFGHQNIQKP
jgi:hypothetical protein